MHFYYFVGVWRAAAGVYGGQDLCVAWVSQNSANINGAAERKVKISIVLEAKNIYINSVSLAVDWCVHVCLCVFVF